ncbi:MAG: peptidoglycan DD-metalloendopeptidase family protein [Clostridia bacterium]|nr:peptidoglycan DD-metalloendopeptidase family protein [Clostridia bacterium]
MKKTILQILVITVMLVLLFQYNIFAANSTSTLKNEKESNNQEINNAQSELKEVQGQKSKAVSEVENLDSKITSCENEIDELDNKITTLNQDIETSEEEVKKLESEAQEMEKLLAERLVLMYEDGNTSYMDFLLSSESLTDFLSKYYMVSELASYDSDLLEKNAQKKKQVVEEKTKLESNKTELATSKSQKEKTQTELESAKKEKSQQVAQLSGEEKEIQQHIDQLKEDNKAIDAQIAAVQAQIQAELQKQKQSSSKNSSSNKNSNSGSNANENSDSDDDSGGSNSSSSSSGFIRPVSGYSVTTGWYYSSGALHGAVDFSGSGISGKPVLAVADGIVVTTAALTSSYGNYIIIAHYNGLYTLYAHGQAGSIAVSQGQKVSQGQQIMRVGSTGNSTGPHLHFEVRTSPGRYANRVNPLNYL